MSDGEPFRRIKPHRDVLGDIQTMQDNLNELETLVRRLEWLELGGRGWVEKDQLERLCDGVENGMPYIKEDLRELHNSLDKS